MAGLAEDYDYEFGTNRIVRQASFTVSTLPPVQADRQYLYSDTNRIFQVIDNGLLNVEYIYNDRGQRTRKTVYDNSVIPVGAITTVYHYDLAGNLIGESDGFGNSEKDYVWVDISPVAQLYR